MMFGVIFAIEGPDGVGKDVIENLVGVQMQLAFGDRVQRVQMPGTTEFGVRIRELCRSVKYAPTPLAERLLFAADNAQTCEAILKPALKEGRIVISHRWNFMSAWAYGLASGVPVHFIHGLHELLPLVEADVVFVLRMSEKERLRRKAGVFHDSIWGSRNRQEEKDAGFLKAVGKFYAGLKDCQVDRLRHNTARIVVLDARKRHADNARKVYAEMLRVCVSRGLKPDVAAARHGPLEPRKS